MLQKHSILYRQEKGYNIPPKVVVHTSQFTNFFLKVIIGNGYKGLLSRRGWGRSGRTTPTHLPFQLLPLCPSWRCGSA